jgi:hypothetical protein
MVKPIVQETTSSKKEPELTKKFTWDKNSLDIENEGPTDCLENETQGHIKEKPVKASVPPIAKPIKKKTQKVSEKKLKVAKVSSGDFAWSWSDLIK